MDSVGVGVLFSSVMATLQDWVSDQLHGLLGMSEKNLVEYVIALAKRSRDEPTFLSSLRDNGVPITDDSRRFAVNLMKKVPRAQVDNKAAEQAALLKKQEKERQQKQIELLKKNSEYTLVEADDADVAAAKAAVEAKRLQKMERKEEKREAKKEKKEMKRHLRKKSKWSEDEAEDGAGGEEPAAKKPKVEEEDADDALEEWELEELERVRDRSHPPPVRPPGAVRSYNQPLSLSLGLYKSPYHLSVCPLRPATALSPLPPSFCLLILPSLSLHGSAPSHRTVSHTFTRTCPTLSASIRGA